MKRILVVATRQIGDVLLTTPLIRTARAKWPQAHVDVLGFAGTLGMLRGNPDISELIETPARLGWRGALALARRLWRRYDLALVTQPGDRAHLMAWIAGRQRSGIIPGHGGSNWWKRLVLDHAVRSAGDRGELHVVEEKLALLDPWVSPRERAAAQIAVPPAAPLPPELQALVRPGFVVLHAPSMWPYKQWPLAHFRILAAQLLARGVQVVLTGSAAARDRECVAALLELGSEPQLINAAGRLDFNQLAALLEQAALYIGPDTSVSHMAAACGVPTLAIFGPTNPMRWAPWPAAAGKPIHWLRSAPSQTVGNVTVLQGSPSCVPCGRAGCDDHLQSRSDCLVSITPQRVLEQALRILGG